MSLFAKTDDSDDSDEITENKGLKSIVKIEALGDGSCFIHSILKCSHEEYRRSPIIRDRKDIAYDLRRHLKDQLREPNPKYSDLKSVVRMVKNHFFGKSKILNKESKGIKTRNFFQVCFGFEYLPLPSQMKPYTVDYFDSLKEYYDYISNYRLYLLEFDKFMDRKIPELPKVSNINQKSGKRENIILKPLNKELLDYIQNVVKFQNDLSKRVNEVTDDLRKILKKGLGIQLYNPQNFGCPYVQAFLRNRPPPKGMYNDIPFNAYFFTANPGMLDRFTYYTERLIPRLEDMERILDDTRLFLGDMDIVPFIPGMFELNIIVINFENNQLINEYSYEETQQDPWIVISNNGNHYDSCGIIRNELIQTIFTIEDPFISTILKSKESQGKIDWSLLN